MTQQLSSIVLVLTSLDESTDAASFARVLVSERLAACVNVLPAMQSIYRWKGVVESAREQQLVIKTTRERVDAVKQRIAQLHPYEVPEIVVIDVVDASASYAAWVIESV